MIFKSLSGCKGNKYGYLINCWLDNHNAFLWWVDSWLCGSVRIRHAGQHVNIVVLSERCHWKFVFWNELSWFVCFRLSNTRLFLVFILFKKKKTFSWFFLGNLKETFFFFFGILLFIENVQKIEVLDIRLGE